MTSNIVKLTMTPASRSIPGVEKPLEELIDEVRLLWNSLVQRGERLHAGESITMGQRAVLEFLLRNGPTTVPNVARSRRVSRQHIQALVDPLLERGLVQPVPNPAHKRSVLLRLSPVGERRIQRMKQREARSLGEARFGVRDADVRRAALTLRALRAAVEE